MDSDPEVRSESRRDEIDRLERELAVARARMVNATIARDRAVATFNRLLGERLDAENRRLA